MLETKISLPQKTVCKVQFAVGEFDMVVHDKESLTCKIYEIKHGKEIAPEQYRHLVDEQNCALTERSYGVENKNGPLLQLRLAKMCMKSCFWPFSFACVQTTCVV